MAVRNSGVLFTKF